MEENRECRTNHGEIYILIHNERSKRIKCRYKTDCISGESNRESTDIRTGIDIPTTYDHTDIQSRYRLDMNYKYEIYGIQQTNFEEKL